MKPICWFVAAALAVVATGCSMIYEDPDNSCVASDEQVYLQFRIVNNTISAREANSRVDYTYEEATGAENYIGIEDKDFRLYVLEGNLTTPNLKNAKLISSYEPTLYPVGSNFAAYDIKIGIDKSKLDLSGSTVKLQFVCFANWHGTGNTSATDYPTVTAGTTTREQLLDLNGMNFYLPTPVSGETVTWAPNLEANENGGRRIPMYGFRTYEFNKALLERSTVNNPYTINVSIDPSGDDGCLYMMRAMARFDVIDNITRATDDANNPTEYPKITSVKLMNWNSNGYCINTNLEGLDSKSYVNNVAIPTTSDLVKISSPLAFQTGLTDNIPAEYAGRPCYCAYLPELRFSDNSVKLQITIQYAADGPTMTTELDLNDLADLKANSGSQLRRNYVYRVVVTTSTSTINLKAEVLPWVIRKNNIEF